MRLRPTHTLIGIIVLTLVAGWLVAPKDFLNIFGLKDEVYVHEGLDLQGGLQVLLEADPPNGEDISSDALTGTRDTIEKRVNELGVSEPLIQTRGDNQIIVELPGVSDPEQAVNVIRETALLEVVDPAGAFVQDGMIVETSLGGPDDVLSDGTPEATPAATPVDGSTPVTAATPEAEVAPAAAATTDDPNIPGPFTTIITGENFNDAFVTQGATGQYVVGFELDGDGADAFYEFTSQNIGRQMAVVLDKEVISAPVINAAISSQGTIEGPPLTEVEQLVVQLKAGSLDVPLNVISSRTVGPTLGQEAIDRSIIAGLVGLSAVALFMIFYYRLPGLLSVAALIIYTMVVFALFKVIPVTLTLAGIAGFVLSIGMAVDANVLIFARLKEELRTGRPLQNAIEAGFDHAWPSIRDSNISTMITSAILYWFGNYTGASIITGFALTLFIGVVISMFTAITVSRTFLRLIVGHGIATNLWWFAVDPKDAAPHASLATGD